MTKNESQSAIKHICHRWREVRDLVSAPPEELIFSDFFSWVGENYSRYLEFRTTSPSVRYDVELWFDQEFKRTGSR